MQNIAQDFQTNFPFLANVRNLDYVSFLTLSLYYRNSPRPEEGPLSWNLATPYVGILSPYCLLFPFHFFYYPHESVIALLRFFVYSFKRRLAVVIKSWVEKRSVTSFLILHYSYVTQALIFVTCTRNRKQSSLLRQPFKCLLTKISGELNKVWCLWTRLDLTLSWLAYKSFEDVVGQVLNAECVQSGLNR